jgi:hypothetical protein
MLKNPELKPLTDFIDVYNDEFGHDHGDDRHHELRILSDWIAASALKREVKHTTSTNRDGTDRPDSQLRKISLLYPSDARQPRDIIQSYPDHASHRIGNVEFCTCARVAETAIKLYAAFLEPAQEYFDMELRPLSDRHAVVAHAYDPGAPAGESHVDVFPTLPLRLSGFDGGELFIANNLDARGMEAIMSDATRITPTGPSVLFFDGRKRPHVVGGVPAEARETRTSLALTYLPADPREIPRIDHPRIPKDVRDMNLPLAS